MYTFGARLRAARLDLNLTQQRLGDAIGVSKGAISRWESDQDQPQFAMLTPLRKTLHVSLDELVCGYTKKRPNAGVSDIPAGYDVLDETEWKVVKALRRLAPEKRDGLITFLVDDTN